MIWEIPRSLLGFLINIMYYVTTERENRMKKKLLSAVLAAAMVLSLTACGKGTSDSVSASNSTPASTSASTNISGVIDSGDVTQTNDDCLIGNIPVQMPISTDGLTLNVMWRFTGVTANYLDQARVWQEYEKMTGIHVNFTDSSSDRKGMTSKALMGGEDYDLICKNKISQTSLVEYGQQGVILDLADLLPQYAPNVWAYLQSHPDTLACIESPEGNIWAIPAVVSGAELRVSRKAWINKTWLDNLGLSVPTTTDELYNVLKAFKEKDANGNGDPNDEIPFCSGDYASIQDMLYGAFGIGTRGTHNMVVDWDDNNNCIRLIGTSDGYKEYLEYLNKLYTEGLLDQETFDMGKTWNVKQADDRVGLFGATNLAGITSENKSEWVALDAIIGPHGSDLWTPIRANFHSTGNCIVPATCKHVKEALAWIDYFWTDEGSLFYHYGIAGDTYYQNDDGITYSYSDSVLAAMNDGQSYDGAVAAVTPYPGGSNPLVEIYPYFGGGETQEPAASAARKLFEKRSSEIWPEFTFTADENTVLSPIKSDVTKTIDEAATAFIIGTKPFSEWDAYVQSIKDMDVDKMLKIYQNAVDRYHNLSK